MDKVTFASYKFKPSDVIEGLNKYSAETKAFRYRRVPLEIRNGEVKPGNYYVLRNIVFDVRTPKVKEYGHCYVICDPKEVVGVAINWLREEHDIFYTPGMEVPVEDFDVDEAAKEYEKATRTSGIFCEENLDVVPVARVREALGIGEDSDILQCIKYRNHQVETLRTEVAAARRMYHKAIEERNQFGKRLADIRHAAGMADDDHGDLVEYIKALREGKERYEQLYKGYEKAYHGLRDDQDRNKYSWLYMDLKDEILKVYREIFDCSNGDPEGTDEETLNDILTEYKRTLELKNVAEEKTIKYKELARENEEKAAKYKDTAKENRVQWNNTKAQLQWAQKENRKWLEKYEKLKSELDEMTRLYCGMEKVKKLEQKLIEIQDICKR